MRHYGHPPGIAVGSVFRDRRALSRAGVHPPPRGGISGSSTEAADSIVLAGDYEDDDDRGDEILYTGQGGRDARTGAQIRDQTKNRGNAALALSLERGTPVRVTRRVEGPAGYRYDGLYRVVDLWTEIGRSGFLILRFRLVALGTTPVDHP